MDESTTRTFNCKSDEAWMKDFALGVKSPYRSKKSMQLKKILLCFIKLVKKK